MNGKFETWHSPALFITIQVSSFKYVLECNQISLDGLFDSLLFQECWFKLIWAPSDMPLRKWYSKYDDELSKYEQHDENTTQNAHTNDDGNLRIFYLLSQR